MAAKDRIPEPYRSAHALSSNNRKILEESKTCGCFYCCKIFKTSEIKNENYKAKGETTAFCPYCGIDSLIPNTSGSLTEKFLKMMGSYWFAIVPKKINK